MPRSYLRRTPHTVSASRATSGDRHAEVGADVVQQQRRRKAVFSLTSLKSLKNDGWPRLLVELEAPHPNILLAQGEALVARMIRAGNTLIPLTKSRTIPCV